MYVKGASPFDISMSSYFSTIQVPVIVKDILYLTAVLNSCMNPIIYGVENENEKSKKWDLKRVHHFSKEIENKI